MDKLKNYRRKIDAVDRKMVLLLEKRMNIVAIAAAYKWEQGVATSRERKEERVIDKAASLACEIDQVEYTEGLIEYLEDISLKYEAKIVSDLNWKKKYSKK
jgi:chorismate mutase